MKHFLSLISIISLCTPLFSQHWYEESMKQSIQQIDTSLSEQQLKKSNQILQRISKSRPNDWLTGYYQALSYQKMFFLTSDKNTKQYYIKNSEEIFSKITDTSATIKTEILILKALLTLQKMMLDTTQNYIYVEYYRECLDKAKILNNSNPRIDLIEVFFFHYIVKSKKGTEDSWGDFLSKKNSENIQNNFYPSWGNTWYKDLIK